MSSQSLRRAPKTAEASADTQAVDAFLVRIYGESLADPLIAEIAAAARLVLVERAAAS